MNSTERIACRPDRLDLGTLKVDNVRTAVSPNPTPNLTTLTVLIVMQNSLEANQFNIWVKRYGGLGVTSDKPLAALNWIEGRQTWKAIVVFDADQFEDANDVVDFGFKLREVAPDVPVIMLSSRVKRNNFTTERMMICDATLKNPVALTAFCLGLKSATQNHACYLSAVRQVHRG